MDNHILMSLELRLRNLLPAKLYAEAWLDPSTDNLTRIFEHLRTLYHILNDYVPGDVSHTGTNAALSHNWKNCTLMCTDLVGFTTMLEQHTVDSDDSPRNILDVLNDYFSSMLDIISRSNGVMLEFTGDALLVQFETDAAYGQNSTAHAVRAGLRMQRMMKNLGFRYGSGDETLGMRIGIHTGRFMNADIGTPRRRDQIIIGNTVKDSKIAEGRAQENRVCLTAAAHKAVGDMFRVEPGDNGHVMVVDDLSDAELGDCEVTVSRRRRQASLMLLDYSDEGIVEGIKEALELVEPKACYVPGSILTLLVENTDQGTIAPKFVDLCVVFVTLLGLGEAADDAKPGEEEIIARAYSHIFTLINGLVEAENGVLKKVTYHPNGSDIVIFFGTPMGHIDDCIRAAGVALDIRQTIAEFEPLTIGGQTVRIGSQTGIACGPVFVAEIGATKGRREYNALGDTMNTAARLMAKSDCDQIMMTNGVHDQVSSRYNCRQLGDMSFKGKAAKLPVFELESRLVSSA